jgi:histidinol phosphatase-like PHP family hydrolase
MIYDFHTHTYLSDGALSPLELIRRAVVKGYKAIAITDHIGPGSLERVISEVAEDCRTAREYWDIIAIPGVELTHLPPQAIAQSAKRAKEIGACLVIVHGETVSEPVEKGTNIAAVRSPHVDILAHPGLLSSEEAELAKKNGIFIELSSRGGHNQANRHVVAIAQKSGVKLILNSDAHEDKDLLTPHIIATIAQNASLTDEELHQVCIENPLLLLDRLQLSLY